VDLVQRSDLSRRERDYAWALSLAPVVAITRPPARMGWRSGPPGELVDSDRLAPHAETLLPASAVDRPVPEAVGLPSERRPVVISDPDHWMPQRFFQRAQRFAASGGPHLPAVGALRHGITYEHYLQRWFDADPEIDLLARDVAVHHEGRTLGQMDFLIRWEGEVYHLEVAIKFYLRMGGTNRLEGYIGSDLRDRLDEKLAHMLYRQRRLPERPETRAVLAARGLPLPDRSAVSIRGLIYHPLRESPGTVPSRWWCDLSEWEKREDLRDRAWTVVTPEQWFSPLLRDEATWLPGEVFDPRMHLHDPGRSICVAGTLPEAPDSGETTRGFIVRSAV
jgi:hypothetical protein